MYMTCQCINHVYANRAEQLPEDWWMAMVKAVNSVIKQCKEQGRPVEVKGICVDTTACRYT